MTIRRQWHLPLDPECEVVAEHAETLDGDLITLVFGGGREVWTEFECLHRGECERCALYGVQNQLMDAPLGFTIVT